MSAPDINTISTLQTWLQKGGAHIGPVRIASDAKLPTHRRLEATAPLPPNTPFIRIPPTHLITTTRARTTPHIIAIQKKASASGLDDKLPNSAEDSAYLLLFLLAELCKGAESFWRPWFDTLPPIFHTPLTAPLKDVLRHLAGAPALPLVQMLRDELRELYDEWFVPFAMNLYPDIYPPTSCSFEKFLYAHAIFESRAFKIEEETVLAPFADMANHAGRGTPGCNARVRGWGTTEARDGIGLEMYIDGEKDAVKPGEELRISYGALANWQLLVHFGFVPEGGRNADDGLVFELDVGEGTGGVQDEMRRMIILQVVCGGEDCVFMLREDDALPRELVRCARVLLLEGEEMDGGVKRDYDVMVSERNERAVIDRLRSVVDSLMDEFDAAEEEEEGSEGEGKDEVGDGGKVVDEGMERLWRYCGEYVNSVLERLERAQEGIQKLEDALEGGAETDDAVEE